MSFKVPEKFRDKDYSTVSDGNNGYFVIPGASLGHHLVIIASDGLGWEHVSVSKKYECPTWEEMCKVKDLFWDGEDVVIQYHPAKSTYVNNHPHCLHLWRPIGKDLPIPGVHLGGRGREEFKLGDCLK